MCFGEAETDALSPLRDPPHQRIRHSLQQTLELRRLRRHRAPPRSCRRATRKLAHPQSSDRGATPEPDLKTGQHPGAASTARPGPRLPAGTSQVLRNTFVTTMLDAGVDLGDVQIAARHADSCTSLRYDGARKNLDHHPQLHPRCVHGLGQITAGCPIQPSLQKAVVPSCRRLRYCV